MPMDFSARRGTNGPPSLTLPRLHTLTVVGDAMEPGIRAHTTVRYLPAHEVTDNGLYVFRLDGALKVTYLQRFAGGALQIVPGNPRYDKELLMPVTDEPHLYRSQQTGLVGRLEIIGKVVHPAC